MSFAFGPEDLSRLAIPIGIGVAILLIVLVPSLRRSFFDSHRKGKEARERLTGKKTSETESSKETEET